jgi:hypothetical protein
VIIKELVGAILLRDNLRFDAITSEAPVPDLRETLEFLMQCTGLKPHSRIPPRGPSRWVEASSALSLIDIRCRIREEAASTPGPQDEPEGTDHE